MTPILNDIAGMKQLDAQGGFLSLSQVGSQIMEVDTQIKSLTSSLDLLKIKKIVVAGMGGSVLGTELITSALADALFAPITIVSDYQLPGWVGEDTVVLAASYSGSSAETVAATKDALAKNAQVLGICSGGELAAVLSAAEQPCLIFETSFNPAATQRFGFGYSMYGQMALLEHFGFIKKNEDRKAAILEAIAQVHAQCSLEIEQDDNPAKQLALACIDQIPSILVAEHLAGAAHFFSNELNENAKSYAEYRVIPEMNHHLMEGLAYPSRLKDSLQVLAFSSNLYSADNSARLRETLSMYADHQLEILTHQLSQGTKLGQAWELVTLGMYTSLYLAMLHGVNPVPVPMVEKLKAALKAG